MDNKNKMSYREAAQLRERGFFGGITQGLVDKKGIGRSISDTFKAKAIGIKEKFDPMNMAKMIGGKFGAGLYGKVMGRNQEDMEHFTGMKGKKSKAKEIGGDKSTKVDESDPMLNEVSDGERSKLKKGDALATALGKLYNLIKLHNVEEGKQFKIKKKDAKKDEKRKQKWHAEIIKALTGKKYVKSTVSKEKKDEGGGIFGGIFDFIKGLISKVEESIADIMKLIRPILDVLKSSFLNTLSKILTVFATGGVLGGLILATSAAALAIWLLKEGSDYLSKLIKENMPSLGTGVTAQTAADILKTNDKKFIKDSGGKEHLESIITGGADRAQKILDSGDKIEINQAGGETVLKQIIEDEKKLGKVEIPKDSEKDARVREPKPTGEGSVGLLKQKVWEEKHGKDSEDPLDPITGLPFPQKSATPTGSSGGASASPASSASGAPSAPAAATPASTTSATPASTSTPASTTSATSVSTPSASPAPTAATPASTTSATPASTSTPASTPSASPAPTAATPMPAQASDIGQRAQAATEKNNDMQIQQNSGGSIKPINIDNSKTIGGGGSGDIGIDSSVDVRNDDSTFWRVLKQNFRLV